MKQKIKALSQKTVQLGTQSKAQLTKVNKRHFVPIGLAVLVTLLTAGFVGLNAYYKDRALPGVQVAGISVSGKKYDEIKAIATTEQAKMKVQFTDEGKEATASATELGLELKADETVRLALQAGRGQFWRAATYMHTDNVALQTTTNTDKFNDFITATFPHIMKSYKDAELVYNEGAKKFEIAEAVAGQGFDQTKFTAIIPSLTTEPRTIKLPVTATRIDPIITGANLTDLQAQMNQRIELAVRFLYKGKLMYFADPPDIAKWATFTPDAAKNGKVAVSYDKAKILQFLTTKVSPYIAGKPIDRKIIKDEKTGAEIVIQQGQMGRQLKNMDELAAGIEAAITSGQSWEKEVTVEEAPFKTVVLTGYDRWIEVDLSEQRTTLYNGTTPVTSFTISSGLARTPTVTGEFAIWYKNKSQTMSGGSRASGDYYSLPNVTWVSYFHKDYSFHTAYWHNNFGTPMSHGCVNMREADAKVVYDFAPVGTKVVVHQ